MFEHRIIHLLLVTVGGRSEVTGLTVNPKFILLFTTIGLLGIDKFDADTDVLAINVVNSGGALIFINKQISTCK